MPGPTLTEMEGGAQDYIVAAEACAGCSLFRINRYSTISTMQSIMNSIRSARTLAIGFCLVITAAATFPLHADEVGDVNVDWLGGDIKVDAFEDPKVKGVTCHVSYFDRGLLDRVRNGQIFTDPSNSSISCRQTGPISIGDIDRGEGGEKVFSKRQSLVWKSVAVTRIYDEENKTLIYLSHATQVKDGSAKMALSTVPLYGQQVTWED